jgi:ABC-type multidrug transport system ATPase subunit
MLSAHSMEEAEALCDRLGIFVDGSLQCIGNPKEVCCSHDMLYQNVFQNENVKWVCVYTVCSLQNQIINLLIWIPHGQV